MSNHSGMIRQYRALGSVALSKPAVVNSLALALSSAFNFIALFVWTRVLNRASFGEYSLVASSAVFVNAAFFEWLRQSAARILYDPASENGIAVDRANAVLLAYLMASGLLAAVTIGLWLGGVQSASLSSRWWPAVCAFSLTEMALGLTNTISRIRLMSWQFFRSMVGRSFISTLLGLVLVEVFGLGSVGIIMGVVVAQSFIVLATVLRDPFWRTLSLFRASSRELVEVVRYGYPLILSTVLSYGATFLDRFMIGFRMDVASVGSYAAPADLMQKTIVFVMMAINITAYPSVVRAFEEEGLPAATKMLERNFTLQLGLGLPVAFGLIVLSPGLAGLLLGAKFRDAGSLILPYVGLTALLRCLITFHLSMIFQLLGKTKLMVVAPLLMVVVVAVIGNRAIDLDGIRGMAIGVLLAQSLSYLVCLVAAKLILKFTLVDANNIKVLIASIVMALALWPFRHIKDAVPTILLVLLGAGLYVITFFALNPRLVRDTHARVRSRLATGALGS